MMIKDCECGFTHLFGMLIYCYTEKLLKMNETLQYKKWLKYKGTERIRG